QVSGSSSSGGRPAAQPHHQPVRPAALPHPADNPAAHGGAGPALGTLYRAQRPAEGLPQSRADGAVRPHWHREDHPAVRVLAGPVRAGRAHPLGQLRGAAAPPLLPHAAPVRRQAAAPRARRHRQRRDGRLRLAADALSRLSRTAVHRRRAARPGGRHGRPTGGPARRHRQPAVPAGRRGRRLYGRPVPPPGPVRGPAAPAGQPHRPARVAGGAPAQGGPEEAAGRRLRLRRRQGDAGGGQRAAAAGRVRTGRPAAPAALPAGGEEPTRRAAGSHAAAVRPPVQVVPAAPRPAAAGRLSAACQGIRLDQCCRIRLLTVCCFCNCC
ncbi:hypothetical protein BOX15_Mlig021746g2, partial [Macrostomum lignano]